MNFAGFLFFSSLEYFSLFCLMLVLFRFEVKDNLIKFGVFSLVLCFVSNTLQMESLQTVSPLIHISLYIFFFIFFLRIHVLNAAIMAVTGQVVFFIVQTILIVLVLQLGLLEEIAPYTKNAFIIQAATAFTMFMIALVTYFQKGGFSFIDNSSKFKRKRIFVKENRLFIIFFTLSVIVTVWANLLFLISKKPPFLFISFFLFIVLVGLIYTSMKRDGTKNG
ncbi:hypothetical protein [Cohnella sp.]|uniref:hypothetical protein n=1 Tax=Cohnella sp. TaxID=1883426 RepID=UPI003564E0C4